MDKNKLEKLEKEKANLIDQNTTKTTGGWDQELSLQSLKKAEIYQKKKIQIENRISGNEKKHQKLQEEYK